MRKFLCKESMQYCDTVDVVFWRGGYDLLLALKVFCCFHLWFLEICCIWIILEG